MYTSIMVPVADALLERGALEVGVRIAHRSRARLHIVHVQESRGDKRRESEGRALLDAVEWAAEELDESVSFQVLEPARDLAPSDTIADALSSYAADKSIDLIVMIRRRHSLHRLLFGSVGQRLLLTQDVPILFLPSRDKVLRAHGCEILAALDGTAADDVVVQDAAQLARCLDGTVTLTRVLRALRHSHDESGTGVDSVIDEEGVYGEPLAQAYLDATAERIAATGVKTRRYTVPGEHVSETVRRVAAMERADVVALAPRAEDYAHFASGSVSAPLLQRPETALLLRRRRQG